MEIFQNKPSNQYFDAFPTFQAGKAFKDSVGTGDQIDDGLNIKTTDDQRYQSSPSITCSNIFSNEYFSMTADN